MFALFIWNLVELFRFFSIPTFPIVSLSPCLFFLYFWSISTLFHLPLDPRQVGDHMSWADSLFTAFCNSGCLLTEGAVLLPVLWINYWTLKLSGDSVVGTDMCFLPPHCWGLSIKMADGWRGGFSVAATSCWLCGWHKQHERNLSLYFLFLFIFFLIGVRG